MKELKKGDFTGIYTRDDNKPLFYTGIFDTMKDEDSRPCVFLATDPDNKNTFYRWTQSDLLKRGYYISKTGKNTIPRTAARLHIIFTHSGSLDGVRAIVEKDIYNRWIATTETGEQYMLFADHVRIAAYCIILKTETAEEIESSGMHPYKITYIKKELEAIMVPEESTTNAQEGPTTAGTTAANETPTAAETAPQNATSDATTAKTATERPETSTAAQDTTGSDTRPPRATEDATTGHAANTSKPATAAGDTSTPANQEPGHAAEAITGRTTTPPHNPGHACENAPGRAERHEAEHVPTAHAKSPPRSTQQAATSRAHALPESYFFRQNAENRSIFPEIFEGPIFYMLVWVNLARFLSGPLQSPPPGGIKK